MYIMLFAPHDITKEHVNISSYIPLPYIKLKIKIHLNVWSIRYNIMKDKQKKIKLSESIFITLLKNVHLLWKMHFMHIWSILMPNSKGFWYLKYWYDTTTINVVWWYIYFVHISIILIIIYIYSYFSLNHYSLTLFPRTWKIGTLLFKLASSPTPLPHVIYNNNKLTSNHQQQTTNDDDASWKYDDKVFLEFVDPAAASKSTRATNIAIMLLYMRNTLISAQFPSMLLKLVLDLQNTPLKLQYCTDHHLVYYNCLDFTVNLWSIYITSKMISR